MGLFKDDSGRTEEPTPHRLDEAADKGQVAMSKELVSATALLAATIALSAGGPFAWGRLQSLMRRGLNVDAANAEWIEHGSLHGGVTLLRELALGLAAPLAVIVVPALVITLVAGYGQIGFRFRKEGLRLDGGRLDPSRNLDRLFNLGALIRAAQSLAVLAAVATVATFLVRANLGTLAALPDNEVGPGFAQVFDIAVTCMLWICALLLLVAFGDVAWQRFDLKKQLRMTRQEVEDERKRTEGDPMVRARLRQAAQELARQRMMEAVPKADVVITNPTHFAVALAYDRGRHAAPEVLAKGTDQVAAKIREIAREHDVPLYEDPPLARALHKAVKVGELIPESFYQAVATVLGHVLKLDRRRATQR